MSDAERLIDSTRRHLEAAARYDRATERIQRLSRYVLGFNLGVAAAILAGRLIGWCT